MRPPHTLPLCFLPQKRQSPWNSCIGDKLLQGLCLLNMYHNISLFREIHTGNMNFFAVARQRASRPSIFLAGIQSARKPVSITSTTMWFCNDVILQRSGVFIAAWSRNCSVPLSLHVFYNKEWNTSVSSGWTRDPCEWIPGPEKDGYL